MEPILSFDPSTEFEILETFDYEEEIQRPEELRFYTLDEQLLDYQSKVVSGKDKLTNFEIQKVYKEVDRIRNIYNRIIVFTDQEGGYTVDNERLSLKLDWVTPIYSDFGYVPYSYAQSWMPIMEKARINNPNYYDQMIKALPRPYKTTENVGVQLKQKSVLVNEEGELPIQALGSYIRTKGVIHEDGRFSLLPIPVSNTEDDIRVKGYYLSQRGVEIPNPISDHPFLASNKDSKLITDESLLDIFPSISAILNHGVPVTTDPYTEGNKFLKIYDVKLNQIPWKSWKERFPPVDTITISPDVASISFPDQKQDVIPSDSLQKEYLFKWQTAMFSRYWLLNQEDGGLLVPKMWISKVGNAGNVPAEPPGDKLQPKFPSSTPDECLQTDNFDNFLNSGVYRKGMCIPVTYIQQERRNAISENKIAWSETMEVELLEEYRKLLRTFQKQEGVDIVPKYEKYAGKVVSEVRKDVVTILSDPSRDDGDKAESIQSIINMLTPVKNLYVDKDDSFIICSHTLSELRGDLAEDRLLFYEKWAAIEGGSRVCKFCGEEINTDVLVAQDEFDSEGHLVVNYESLESNIFHGEHSISSFTNSLTELGKLFDKENAGEAVLYLLLLLLQVLPNESILVPILQSIRKLSMILKARKVEKSVREKAEGAIGIAASILLLQIHDPFLIPRAKFGIKIFSLSGFPRDSTDPKESKVLDNILAVLRAFFKDSPGTFRGPVVPIFRALIASPKKVREEIVRYLTAGFPDFKTQLESAKQRYVEPARIEEIANIMFPVIHVDKLEFKPSERLGTEELMMKCDVPKPKSILTNKLPPKVSQDPQILDKNLVPSKEAVYITLTKPEYENILFNDKDIRRRLNIGLAKITKGDKIEKFLRYETVDGVSILTLLNRILDIVSLQNFDQSVVQEYRRMTTYLQTRINSSLLRDVAKGILYELFQDINKSSKKTQIGKALDDALLKDIVMNMILFTKEEAERITEEVRTKERNKFKATMRSLNDKQREVTKNLLDIGLAPYIITNEDREIFARDYNYPDPEEEYNAIVQELDEQRPEEGYNDTRDFIENGDIPLNVMGDEMQVDYGDYGDRAVRPYDDYANTIGDFELEE